MHEKPGRSQERNEQAPAQPSSLPVLVIEYDTELCERLYTVLESAGYPVVCVYSEKNVESLFDSLLSPSPTALGGIAGIVAGSRKFAPLNADDFCGWLPKKFPHLTKRILFLHKPLDYGQFVTAIRETIGLPTPAERILVVDDDEPLREIVRCMLSFAGYRCRCVPNGIDALKLLESGERFHLITSDIANTPMWGTEFLVEVKRRFPEIPTLVITGCRDLSEQPACIPRSAYDGFLKKPFEREELSLSIQRALGPRP